MKLRYNPFRPNGIAGPGMFTGRVDEVFAIEQSLNQTKNGNPQHFLLEGERGIGKSSLMLLAQIAATGGFSEPKFNFVVVDVEILTTTTYAELFRKIAISLRSALMKNQHLKTMAGAAWDFITNWSILGVEYKKDSRNVDPQESMDHLASAVKQLVEQSEDAIDGVLILIDEADKCDPSAANIGEFVKMFTEKMTRLGCERACLGLAGLHILTQKLRQGHESSLRVFETYMLQPLTREESMEVVRRGLSEAAKKNGFETKIDDDAIGMIAHLAEGYPHFIQQFSHCAFDHDSDNHITIDDVISGAHKENGALDQLGSKYFRELYFDKISSSDYRTVLKAMANNLDAWTPRGQIIKDSGIRESQVTNALNALKGRNIIFANEERKGEYRLPTRSFAVWIKAMAEKTGA